MATLGPLRPGTAAQCHCAGEPDGCRAGGAEKIMAGPKQKLEPNDRGQYKMVLEKKKKIISDGSCSNFFDSKQQCQGHKC